MAVRKYWCRFKRKFQKDDGGGVTIEFMLWVPVFVALMTGAVDIGTIFANKSNYWGVARDTARQVARHAMTNSEAEAYAAIQATFGSVVPTVTVSTTTTEVTVSISGSTDTIAAFGIFSIFDGGTVSASVTHSIEPL